MEIAFAVTRVNPKPMPRNKEPAKTLANFYLHNLS
jgi:hypothetical protein